MSSKRTVANGSMSFGLAFCSGPTNNSITWIYAFVGDTSFCKWTIIVYLTFVLETFVVRVASPIGWASAYWSVRSGSTNSSFATRFIQSTWVEALIFNTSIVIRAFTVVLAFSFLDLGTLAIWISFKSRRTSAR